MIVDVLLFVLKVVGLLAAIVGVASLAVMLAWLAWDGLPDEWKSKKPAAAPEGLPPGYAFDVENPNSPYMKVVLIYDGQVIGGRYEEVYGWDRARELLTESAWGHYAVMSANSTINDD